MENQTFKLIVSELAYLYADRNPNLSRRDAILQAIDDIRNQTVSDVDAEYIVKIASKALA